ncbi:MAG TPA: hypothetical protein VL334_13220 [Anaerolineae bacterium]|nr:hypothetical protein [Anaerolineae bacterium]
MSEQHDLTVGDTAEYEPQPVANEADISDDRWENADEDPIEYPDEQVLDDWIIYPSMAMGVVITTFFPILLGQQICLPLLSAAVLIPMFLWALRQGRPRKAVALALFWVVVQSLSVIVASLLFTDSAADAVQGGLEYRTAWLAWIEGGPLVQMAPALDYVRQLLDLAGYALAMALTGGVGGLLLLTVALNRLNFTVATLLAAAQNPVLLAVAAWPLWMVVRLVGYLIVGAVLAEPVANLDLRPAYLAAWLQARKRLLLAGLGIILLGVLLQALLSPLYQTLLHNALD